MLFSFPLLNSSASSVLCFSLLLCSFFIVFSLMSVHDYNFCCLFIWSSWSVFVSRFVFFHWFAIFSFTLYAIFLTFAVSPPFSFLLSNFSHLSSHLLHLYIHFIYLLFCLHFLSPFFIVLPLYIYFILTNDTLKMFYGVKDSFLFLTVNKIPPPLKSGALTPLDMSTLEVEQSTLLAALRPDAVSLVDAFDIHDRILDSTLGCWDGNVYHRWGEDESGV